MNLSIFTKKENFFNGLKDLFESLHVPVNYIDEKSIAPKEILSKTFKDTNEAYKLMDDVFILSMVDDAAFKGKKSETIAGISKSKKDYEGILLFGVTLKNRANGLLPTRSQLAEITRAFNREFYYTPVVVVFRYEEFISIANAERTSYKQEWREGEKAGKVSLLRDINVSKPHTGHLKILQELTISRTGKGALNAFTELYTYWQSVFNVSILNKKFYKELSDWYFWALHEVQFPTTNWAADKTSLLKDEEKVKEHNAKNLIRMLTRLLFVWFVKEKNLVPEELFDESYIRDNLINGFEPRKKKNFDHKSQGSKYYRAILQNLFFATLNQTVGKREFRKDGLHMNVTNMMRYESYFKNPKAFIKLVENIVPFMNGGLFECLDSPDPLLKGKRGGDVIIYEDGFSDRKDNTLCVPDYIFFGTDERADLSEELGNNKFKDVTVNGLINILNSYKFTVTENTPIEEDVALDPELLGRVFENLLASYNPETQTTARKQTGSFYTPREIVNYMVDESLIAYFKTRLTPGPSLKERGGKTIQMPGYVTAEVATYKVTKQFALENRQNATKAEAVLWEALRNQKLGKKFRRQHPIDKFIVDFVCLEEKLVIEVDGSIHDVKEQQEHDAVRTDRLVSLGYHELRFSNNEILSDLNKVLNTISSSFSSASSSTPSPLERGPGGEVDSRLRKLLSYSDDANPFSAQETDLLIAAIDSCKILDPACGSGAFPMGILHKLVLVLHKLDPQNEKWKIRQIQKTKQIDDADLRDKYIEDIEEAFKNNELDYGRKLYLIENCIYGVDIQPIAVQIAKLRFFISLIIDQNKRPDKENLGIRSLPNLETKFVAANTLLGLPQQTVLRNAEIDDLEIELKSIRHDYFSAKTRKDKLSCQKKDKELRNKIALLLESSGWDKGTAKQVAQFDPYDQNKSATFFDLEWMFGFPVGGGFDVVIGNPPYVQIQNFSGMQEQKDWEKQKFETYAKTGDVYCLFYERGYRLLRSGGVLTFITSNKWMRANYGKVMRKYFNINGTILQLIDFGDSPIFENATTYTNILVWKKDREAGTRKTKAWDLSKVYAADSSLEEMLEKQGECDALFSEDSYVVVKGEQTKIKRRIEAIGTPLKDWDIKINYGIKTGLNEAFIIDGNKKDELIAKDPKSAEILKPILRGRDIKRYKAEFADLWLIATFPALGLNIDKYPSVKKHLQSFGKKLHQTGEEFIDENGEKQKSRKATSNKWFEVQDTIAYYPEFDNEKAI